MSSKRWLAKNKNDRYYLKSKKDGYRARAAYKLIQINDKFKIFNNTNSVLDLGAAPGSWIQVILHYMSNQKPIVMGVDYKRMGLIEGVKMLSINIYADELETEIKTYFSKGIDLILSDLAPKISGNKELDAAKTISLVQRALYFAQTNMNLNGKFVAKIFQCPELHFLLSEIKQEFQVVQTFKPKASKSGNRETYIIARGFKSKKKKK